jgi:hypothetical protein
MTSETSCIYTSAAAALRAMHASHGVQRTYYVSSMRARHVITYTCGPWRCFRTSDMTASGGLLRTRSNALKVVAVQWSPPLLRATYSTHGRVRVREHTWCGVGDALRCVCYDVAVQVIARTCPPKTSDTNAKLKARALDASIAISRGSRIAYRLQHHVGMCARLTLASPHAAMLRYHKGPA